MKRIGLLFILILAICGISFTTASAQTLEYDWCAGIYFWDTPNHLTNAGYNLYVGRHQSGGPPNSLHWQLNRRATLSSYPILDGTINFGVDGSELAFSTDFNDFPVSIKGYRAWFHYSENDFMVDDFSAIDFSYNMEIFGLRDARAFYVTRPGGVDFHIEDFRNIPSDPSSTINITMFADDPSPDWPQTRHWFSFLSLTVFGDGQNPFHVTSFGNDYWVANTGPCEEVDDIASTRVPGTPLPQLPSPTPTITPTITPTLELSHTPSPTTTATTTSTLTPTPTPSWSPSPTATCALQVINFPYNHAQRTPNPPDETSNPGGNPMRGYYEWSVGSPVIQPFNEMYYVTRVQFRHYASVTAANAVTVTLRDNFGNYQGHYETSGSAGVFTRTITPTVPYWATSIVLDYTARDGGGTGAFILGWIEVQYNPCFPTPTATPSTTATPTATATVGTPPPTNTIDWWLTPSPTRTPYPTNTRPWWWTPPPTQTPLPRLSPIAPTQTPLATTTRVPILPPPSPLPTATVQIWPTWTPSPMISSTPMATTTGTGTPMMVVPWEGEGGDGGLNNITDGIGSLGGGVLGVMSNFMQQSVRYLGEFRTLVTRVSTSWANSPAVAIPGMPDCVNFPFASQLCAIWYIVRWTIFGAPLGGVISLIMTIIVDLFILFEFIKLVRAILSRAKEILKS